MIAIVRVSPVAAGPIHVPSFRRSRACRPAGAGPEQRERVQRDSGGEDDEGQCSSGSALRATSGVERDARSSGAGGRQAEADRGVQRERGPAVLAGSGGRHSIPRTQTADVS